MIANKVRLSVELIIEEPENCFLLSDWYLEDWLTDQLPEFISLPFDNCTRALLSVDVECDPNIEIIEVQ